MFPAHIYDRGLTYYKNERVTDLLYDVNNHLWTATVLGTEPYFVEINLRNIAKGRIGAYCECPAFATYESCKHIVAVLLSASEKSAEETSVQNFETTNRFIQALTETQATEANGLVEKIPMHVEYYCKWSYERHLHIELKTGEGRCFVVKDVAAFLNNVRSGRSHYFTKTFTFHPDTHYFLQRDLKIFDLLLSILRNEEMYQGIAMQYYHNNTKRSVVIPPLLLKDLLGELMERDFLVSIHGHQYEHTDVIEGDLPLQFALTKSDQDDLLFVMDDISEGVYFEDYQVFFHLGTFYFPTKEQVPILEQITRIVKEQAVLPINQEQADTFLSEVLPSIKKVGTVEIAEKVAEEIIQVPLKAKLYLKMDAHLIVGELTYQYGQEVIDPFSGHEPRDVMIIRDIEKEQHIMNLIEHASFRYNGKFLYIETDEDILYDFLYTILPLLDKHVELFLTSEVQRLIIENEPLPSTSVEFDASENLLEIGFDMDGVRDEEVQQILNAVIERKRYYRMDSGALLSLEGDAFASMKQMFRDLDVDHADVQSGHIQMPVYRGAQIDELIGTRKNYDPAFRKLLHQLKSPEEQVYELPDNLLATLRDYQMTGFQWFKSLSTYHLGGILADDMGLGKTLQTIAYLLSEPKQPNQPHLVIAPSSVLYNWKNECHRFAPDLTVTVMTGTPAEREEKIKTSAEQDIWITSYATLRQDIDQYIKYHFQTLILDESQYIKNYATKTSQAIRQIQAGRKFALSGTPIENSIEELWAVFQAILPGLMPNQRMFKQYSPEKIATLTKPFILRRVKEDVLTELPEKIESVHVSELTKEQKDLYVGYLRQVQQEASTSMKESGFQKNRMRILAGLTRLRQLCCHPSLFIENYEGQSGKLEQLLETVRNAMANGKRMLIFSQFTTMHAIIIEALKKEGIDYFYLHGQTPSEERVHMSEQFNAGEKSVFLISLRAGGTGLNLTGADTVILYDLWWNPAVEDQATGRAHRFGQKKVVQVIRLIAEGTIEEKIYALQQKKRALVDQVIQPGETMLSSLNEEDIRELLSI